MILIFRILIQLIKAKGTTTLIKGCCLLLLFACKFNNTNNIHHTLKEPIKADMSQLYKRFYLGSHLAREPMPPLEELKKDMETLKKNGFNLIKLQEHWAVDEPEEGKYDFSKYEQLITHAKSLGMYVYLGLTCEQAPAWLYEKYPDCRMVGRNGLTIMHEAQSPMPADGKPGPCFDHPEAMKAQLRFIKKLVETLGKYDNILVWNTWQEIGYWSERLVGQPVCYCDNTLHAFRNWLKKKYGSLDNLNKAWKTNYAKWKYIKPNRNYQQRFTLPQDVNWQYFLDNFRLTNILKKRAAIIWETDSMHRPVFCHLGDWVYGSGKDWNYARSQDFLGSSSYPASNWGEFNDWDDINFRNGKPPDKYESLLDETWRILSLRFDYLRSCNIPESPIWASEFQGGPVSTGFHKGRVPSRQDIRRWMLSSIGAGITAISFWVTRAEIAASETNGFSLLDSEGDDSPRFLEAARVGKALIKHQDIFAYPSSVKAKVAIFVNEDNYQICANMLSGNKHLEFSTRGWHRLLWEANIPVDFLEASVLDHTDLTQYHAIVMPFPISVSDTLLKKLGEYVESGGNLISEAGIARFNENAFSYRGEMSPMARKLFGVKQKSFTMVREPDGGTRWSPWERTWGEYLEATFLTGKNMLEGVKTPANVYIQTFDNVNSEPCLFYEDQIAGTVRQYGKGKTWLLGTYVGHNGTAYRNKNTKAFIKKIMQACNVAPEHNGKLLIRRRVIKNKKALIVFNPTPHTVTEKLSIDSKWKHAIDLFDTPVEIKNGSIRLSIESLETVVVILL